MSTQNAREVLGASAHWLGWQHEDLSFGLRSAFDGLRLYEYWISHPGLPEMCDEESDDENIDVTEHRIKALGYDPLHQVSTIDAPCGTAVVIEALQIAEKLLDSVAFVTKEGDTLSPLKIIRAITSPEPQGVAMNASMELKA